ncbi:MAG: Abi family protein [Muribaculaceae bacterium]|nr:Abi family protein [Muribaculaceae bacterium]
MTLPLYNQPNISVLEQLGLLKSEGLLFADENRARHIFENISLFRLKSYLKPFRMAGSHKFKPGASFEGAYNLYKFDAELRKMVCSELEKIEISIRTQFSLAMGESAGIYWFENSDNFKDISRHAQILSKLKAEIDRSDDEAILNFRKNYSNTCPPSWMTFEVSSFGTLSMMYRWLKSGHSRRGVAQFYGLSDTVMESWMHSIVYVRNICAHHSRLWNRRLSINALIPRNPRLQFIDIPNDTKRVYYIMSIILYLLQSVNPHNNFASRFKSLIAKYPDVDVSAMGFPANWESEALWR